MQNNKPCNINNKKIKRLMNIHNLYFYILGVNKLPQKKKKKSKGY